jgi:hypothetical protein
MSLAPVTAEFATTRPHGPKALNNMTRGPKSVTPRGRRGQLALTVSGFAWPVSKRDRVRTREAFIGGSVKITAFAADAL